jgi:hypothetical protein
MKHWLSFLGLIVALLALGPASETAHANHFPGF